MKYLKLILIAILVIVLPFAILKASLEYNDLSELGNITFYVYPIGLPVFCGWFGVQLFKNTKKVILPTVIFNVFMVVSVCCLTQMIFDSIERSLADVAIGLLLYGPMVISIPISPIAAAICRYRNKRCEASTVEEAIINKQ